MMITFPVFCQKWYDSRAYNYTKNPKMKTAVIIVNYNKKELLEKCLQSLQKNNYSDAYAIVVDNGSTDGSIELMSTVFPETILIEMGYNSGFCKANNVGIQKAIDDGCDVVVLLNNDTEVDENFIAAGVNALDMKKKIGMIAPKILFHTHRDQFDSAGLIITKDGLAVNRLLHESSDKGNEVCEVFCPAGAAAFFATEVLNDIKQDGMYFDESYAYYLEDLDMGWRARLRGWVCVYTPQSIVYHYKNATSGGYSKFIAFHTNRNLFYNIIKNYPGMYCVKALLYSVLRYPYLLALAVSGKGIVNRFQNNVGTMDLLIVTVKGFGDVIFNMCSLLKKRRYIQKNKINTDFSVWFEDFGIGFFESKK